MRRQWTVRVGISGIALLLAGCVMQSKYNSMLQQQESLEASLRAEINADQVKIEVAKSAVASLQAPSQDSAGS